MDVWMYGQYRQTDIEQMEVSKDGGTDGLMEGQISKGWMKIVSYFPGNRIFPGDCGPLPGWR